MIDAAAAAEALIRARTDYQVLDEFPGGEFPADLDEGYAVLDAIAAKMVVPIGGWKAAFTNDAVMRKMQTTAPACGPLFQPYIRSGPAHLNLPAHSLRGIECEFAFRMGAALPPRGEPYTNEETAAAVATLHPAIEVVDTRVKNGMTHGARTLIADFCANAALVYGAGFDDWDEFDLASHEVTLHVDGEAAVTGIGREVMGDPRNALTWIANFLSNRGKGLKAGEWVTTGSTMGIYPAPAGSEVVTDFGTLGTVDIQFSG